MELSRAQILTVGEPKPTLFPPEVLHVVSYQRTQLIPCYELGELINTSPKRTVSNMKEGREMRTETARQKDT